MKNTIPLIIVLIITISCNRNGDKWVSLFDGKTLNGWIIDEGFTGNCYVEDGVIIGEVNKSMYFLRSENPYNDFILELEFKIDSGINSGVQVRSYFLDEDITCWYTTGRPDLYAHDRTFRAGSFAGYQFEIETTPRAWTAGFYEEGGRGWLQPLLDDQPSKQAFLQNEWNLMRIKANGGHFKSWLNGASATDYHDDKVSSGFIGFQFHNVKEDSLVGRKIQFRNIRIQELHR